MDPKAFIKTFFAFAAIIAALGGNVVSAPMVGGYSSVETTKDDVKSAADFAVGEQSRRESGILTLTAISKAEKQVVAGLNYRLTLTVTKGKVARDANVVVFHALDSHYELTSWEWLPPGQTGGKP